MPPAPRNQRGARGGAGRGDGGLRYALQLAPFVSLLCAAVWQEFIRLDKAAKVEAPSGVVHWVQALFFIVPGAAGVAAALCVGVTGGLFRRPQIAAALRTFGVVPAAVLCGGLLALGAWHLRLEYRRQFAWAAGTLALSAWLLMMIALGALHSVPGEMTDPARAPVEAAVAQRARSPSTRCMKCVPIRARCSSPIARSPKSPPRR
jgi:hypothetical protein